MGLGAGIVPALAAVCMVGVPLLVAGPLVALVVLGWQAAALMACRRAVGRVPAVVAFVAAGLVCAVGWQLAGLVGVVAGPVAAVVLAVGAWRLAGVGAHHLVGLVDRLARMGHQRARGPRTSAPGRDDLPVVAFRDGALYVPETWWTQAEGESGRGQLAALDRLGRMLPPPERAAFTQAMLDALATGRRIEVRALSAGGVS